jgi:cell wall assembly regulator SMI1
MGTSTPGPRPEPRLDASVLRCLEARWREDGASWATQLRPGRSPGDVATALNEMGVAAHEQLIDWWSWHDGVSAGGWIGGGAQMLRLDVAREIYREQRAEALAMSAAEQMDADLFWPWWCVPLFASGGSDFWSVDCSEGPERGYVRFHPFANVADNYGSPIAASLGALLGELSDCYTRGTVNYLPELDSYEDSGALAHWMWSENVQPPPRRAGF